MSESSATILGSDNGNSTAGERFTPGPWHLENSARHDYDVAYRTKDGLYGGWFLSLDHGVPLNEATPESRAEFEANARLISAAPDMYEACRVALGWMTGGMDGDWRDCDYLSLLRAALAKAEGRAPAEIPEGAKTTERR